MQLSSARISDALPWPPMTTLDDALIGLERGMATAGVAWMSPEGADPADLRVAAGVVTEAADIVARSTTARPDLDLPLAATQARAGAALLVETAVLLEALPSDPAGDDPFGPVSAAAERAFREIKRAFLTAGGG